MSTRAAALAVGAIVLLLYGATLAPTVTFWDAGELIAAAYTLGIPHPPGTPLFVLLAHVWALVLPLGEYAFRINLLSAVASAAAAVAWFMVAHETTRRMAGDLSIPLARIIRLGGASAAAFAGAFSFTNWGNSNETEVYAVATLTVALLVLLAIRWRERRSPATLLLAIYLMALSVGNHLLALLAGPALLLFLVSVARSEPASDNVERESEWARIAMVGGAWTLVLGAGLGSGTMFLLGLGTAAVAVGVVAWRHQLGFGLAALALAAAGVSTYLFLYIRAGQDPAISEAAPSTWGALVDVIGRAQYPLRTPFDDPTVPHGPDNPGRSFSLLGTQLLNYVQYFDWQWARGLDPTPRLLVTMVMAWLGLRGLFHHRTVDRHGFRLLLTLFLVTGLGLVLYMNFKPGYSLGLDQWPNREDHEVRERDYFFVVSFVVWGVWIGIGLADIARRIGLRLAARPSTAISAATLGVLSTALAPVVLNAAAATRRGANARLAADVAYDLLNSVPPYGVLFTNGDNDTFPLWWAQEVEGIRRDVNVVCLALAHTPWYARQIRDRPLRNFDAVSAPPPWRDLRGVAPPGDRLHTMADDEIDGLTAQRIGRALRVDFGWFRYTYPPGAVFYPGDVVAIRILQQNLGRRPVVWSLTASPTFEGLDDRLVQQGLGLRVDSLPPDDADRTLYFGPGQLPLDVPLTRELAERTYRYAGLDSIPPGRNLEPAEAGMARFLAGPFARLAEAAAARSDSALASRYAERASRIRAP